MNKILRQFIIFYHCAFAYAANHVISQKKGDALGYWFVDADLETQSWHNYIQPGTSVIKLITYPFVKFAKFPIEVGFVLFSLISCVAVIKLYDFLMAISADCTLSRIVSYILILLPGFHFWTSNIGKEAILILPTTLVAVELFKKKYFSPTLFISVLIIGLIRPHFALIMVVSLAVSLLIFGKLSLTQKIYVGIGVIAAAYFFIILLFSIQDFSGGFDRIIKKMDHHVAFFRETASYVPVDQYNWLLKIFTFYFRPLLAEKTGLFYFIFSFENTVFLIIFIMAVFKFTRHFKLLSKNMFVIFSVLFSVLFSVIFANAYANYGILARTKIMAYPFLYILLVFLMSGGKINNRVSHADANRN